jgi:hypothetical protein
MAAEATRRQQVAAEGERILCNTRHTVYQHKTFVDVTTGTYDMDCSGYVGYVLGQIAPLHYHAIPKETHQDRPRAFEYPDFFSSLPPDGAHGWRRIDRLADARRGDIIGWSFGQILPHQDTGHVVIVADDPEPTADGALSVRVYDSSQVPHFDDTRGHGGDSPETGLGSGNILFRVNDAGKGIAFQFGPSDPFYFYPILIGRLEPLAR